MKKLTKLLSVLSAGVLAVCAAPVSAFAEESGKYNFTPEYALGNDLSLYEKGDVDLDGKITPFDATLILVQANGAMIGLPDEMNEDQLRLADVDGESVWLESEQKWYPVSAADAMVVLVYTAFANAGFEPSMDDIVAGKR